MNRKETIEQKLKSLNPNFLEIRDTSADHAGHAGNPDGIMGTHFELIISSDILENYIKIEQHRIINDLLKEEFNNGLHALSIKVIKRNNQQIVHNI